MTTMRAPPMMRMARAEPPISKLGTAPSLFGPPKVEFSSASYSPEIMPDVCSPAVASLAYAEESLFGASTAMSGDSYSTINDEIKSEQVERLVQKALHRKKK